MVSDMKVVYFTQKLDHFGHYVGLHDATFQQKVVINDTLWGGAQVRAPIFVLLGNEDGLTFDPNIHGILALCASEFRAMLIHIEHRFYGESIPYGSIDLAMANHRVRGCLSTEQALQDIAVVIQSLKANLSSLFSPVIVVGKGYGGALATWFRLKYPEIAIGAFASSTPLYYFGNTTQPDGYCSIVSQDFQDANPKCYESIRKSWKKIDDIASQSDGVAKLSSTFNTCRPLQSADEIKDILGQYCSYIAQYNDPVDFYLNRFCYSVGRGTIEGIVRALYVNFKERYCFNSTFTGVNSPFEPISNMTIAWAWQVIGCCVWVVGLSIVGDVVVFGGYQ
ncbi:Lysosomal Pro-X carboxypeptidase [Bienertia sinuspersici]